MLVASFISRSWESSSPRALLNRSSMVARNAYSYYPCNCFPWYSFLFAVSHSPLWVPAGGKLGAELDLWLHLGQLVGQILDVAGG